MHFFLGASRPKKNVTHRKKRLFHAFFFGRFAPKKKCFAFGYGAFVEIDAAAADRRRRRPPPTAAGSESRPKVSENPKILFEVVVTSKILKS